MVKSPSKRDIGGHQESGHDRNCSDQRGEMPARPPRSRARIGTDEHGHPQYAASMAMGAGGQVHVHLVFADARPVTADPPDGIEHQPLQRVEIVRVAWMRIRRTLVPKCTSSSVNKSRSTALSACAVSLCGVPGGSGCGPCGWPSQ